MNSYKDKLQNDKSLHQYHSSELKARIFFLCFSLILSFISCFFQIEYLLYKLTSILLQSLKTIENTESFTNSGFIFTELLEGFWSSLLLSGYAAFLLSLPIIYYNIYKFLLPGLTYLEARFLKSFIYLSLFFIFFTHLLTYFFILPYAASFFLSFQSNYPQTGFISFTGRIYPALTFILNCFTLVTFLFQLPLLLFFLFLYFDFQSLFSSNFQKNQTQFHQNEIKKKTSQFYNLNFTTSSSSNGSTLFLRKILFFSLVFLTAVFSPPDLYSQLFLFLPLFLILESFIFLLFIFQESPYSRYLRGNQTKDVSSKKS